MCWYLRSKIRQVGHETISVQLSDAGTAKPLSILPLIDWYAVKEKFGTEAGVSYLIRTDELTVLIDVGLNPGKAHPSPLLQNMSHLGIAPDDLDGLVITHAHLDHLGGMREQRNREFSFSQGPVSLDSIPVYTPVPVSPSRWRTPARRWNWSGNRKNGGQES